MLAAVEEHLLPLGLKLFQGVKEVAGGYFIWITLPDQLIAEDIRQRAQRDQSLIIQTGPKCGVDGDNESPETAFQSDIRLSFAWEDEDLLEEGIRRLAKVIRAAQG